MNNHESLSDRELRNLLLKASEHLEPKFAQQLTSCVNELLQYRKKVKKGILKELPRKIDDKVYWVVRDYDSNGATIGWEIITGRFYYGCLDYWNKTCFPTKAQAKIQLKEFKKYEQSKKM